MDQKVSPASRPPSSKVLSGKTDSIRVVRNPSAELNTSVMMRKPARKFIKEPAARMTSRFHHLALVKARGLSLAASSPSMAQ